MNRSKPKMKVLDLFSGIGGFSLGLERAGMHTIGFCELDNFCQRVLKKHWPHVPIHEDIKTLKGDEFGTVELICGGYPCQPFSLAGKRRGNEDDRHLWPEMLRIIKTARPSWVVCENVRGHINMGLDDVLLDLENNRYASQSFVVPALAANAPHRRDRVWIVAHADSELLRQKQIRQRKLSRSSIARNDGEEGFATNSNSQRRERGSQKPSHKLEKLQAELVRSCEDIRKQWTAEPRIRRVVNGISSGLDRSKRIKALGNAVVPQIAEIIGRAIMIAEKTNLGG